LVTSLPVLLALSCLAWLARFARWRWLLARAGNHTKWKPALLGYLAGFAFTATPGKVGELIRIRYFSFQGVPGWKVLAAFVYERACDLLVVLALACLAVDQMGLIAVLTGFVGTVLAVLACAAYKPHLFTGFLVCLRRRRLTRMTRVVRTLRDGLSGSRRWFNALDVLVSMSLGLVAWGAISLSFVYLILQMGVALPIPSGLAIYPLAMLVGAASMLPGGIGSTEAAIVVLLTASDVPLDLATFAAVGIRIVTLWFAIACGLLALGFLELSTMKNVAHASAKA
jgi:uncharacterized protein (TIRG00374 family)